MTVKVINELNFAAVTGLKLYIVFWTLKYITVFT